MDDLYLFICPKCHTGVNIPRSQERFYCASCGRAEVFDSTPINPDHYHTHSTECIDIAEHMSFNMGNALKYIWRAGKKDVTKTVEDLKKAQWYVEREINRLERLEEKK